MPDSLRTVDERIKALIEGQFGSELIKSIETRYDVDHDEDQILQVRVVLHGDRARLDHQKVLETIRLLRHDLAKIDEWSFPVVSYVTEQEDRDAAA